MIPQSPLSQPPVNYLQGQQQMQPVPLPPVNRTSRQPPSFDAPGLATGSPHSSPVKTPYVPNGNFGYSPAKPGFGPCQSPVKQVAGSWDQSGQYWQQQQQAGYSGGTGPQGYNYNQQQNSNSDTTAQQYQSYQGY